eukprot:scaffold4.g4847.t1
MGLNAPDRYEKFVVPEGVKKIEYAPDTKVANAGTFTIQREDHTVGNLVRTQLHRDSTITFAGYKIPHPLEYQMLIKVQTNGQKHPIITVQDSLTCLSRELTALRKEFVDQAQLLRR